MPMPPVFFPTRILLIDDEPQVLRMTARLFRQRREVAEVLTFADAVSALAFVERERARLPALDAFAAARVNDEFDDEGPEPAIRRRVEIRLADVTGVLDVAMRHELISVVVCDYAMPVMDGLEFFARTAGRDAGDPNTRRVLLTALCDEHRAIQAFNRGAIHHFVHKADPAGPRGLETMLTDQVQAFFRAHTSHLAAALAFGPAGRLLDHPSLPSLLGSVMEAGGFREYSFCAAPLGFRLGAGAHRALLLLADTDAFLRAQRVVDEIDGPASLAQALRARTVLPAARDGAPIYDAGDDWRELAVAPAVESRSVETRSAEPLYWAVID
jgi:CheY-like chemotaxis protein